MALKSKVVTYEFTPEEINELIKQHLNVGDSKSVKVSYDINEVGGDCMDRYPGYKKVTSITVRVEEKQ